MSQNFGNNDPQNTGGGSKGTTGNKGTTGGGSSNKGTTGGAGTGATDAGTTREASTGGGLTTTTGATGTGTATAREGLAGTAQEYGQKIADAATTAKDYMSDKVSVVGDKFKDLQNKDFSQVAEEAKNYAREKPGQALLISAAAGFLIGLLLKSSNRR
ncbi:MAG: DUF883 C-terminal domain-containing protein [Acidobacteria bacterium]|nr:DUF883 C-terminal domain-containing protein [Acidobacteriota bacterium]